MERFKNMKYKTMYTFLNLLTLNFSEVIWHHEILLQFPTHSSDFDYLEWLDILSKYCCQ